MNRPLSLIFLLVFVNPAFAEKVPVLPGGIVFPGLTDAIRENAAIIPKYQAKSIQFFMKPTIDGNGTRFSRWGLGYTTADERGVGYGLSYSVEDDSHALYAAAGLKIAGVSVGLTLHEETLEKSFSPHADVGISVAFGPRWNMGFRLEEINLRPKLGFGIGAQSTDQKYSLEGAFYTPRSGAEETREDQNYSLRMNAKMNLSTMGLGYGFDYLTVDANWKHTLTVLANVNPKLSLMLQLSHPINYQLMASYQF